MTFLVDGTLGGTFPSWTTATRPASPAVGQMGYNTTIGQFDAYTSNGWVSVATSATAPTSGPTFSASSNTNQSFTSAATVKVTLSVEDFDTNNNFASSRFTPTVAGYYQLNALVQVGSGSSNITEAQAAIFKNGATALNGTYIVGPNSPVTYSVSAGLIYMNGTSDYVEMYGYGVGTSPYFRFISSTNCSTFSGFLARSA